MTKTTRVSMWIPIYLDINKSGEDVTEEDVEEAFSSEYGNGPTIEVNLDFMPDWQVVDEWSE
jgi:hypothetical protein